MIYAGIDLGGTNIAAGAVNENGVILSKVSVKTEAERPYADIIRDMVSCVREAVRRAGRTEADLAAVGVGVPGAADAKRGLVIASSNLGWTDVPVREKMRESFSCPILIGNDANVAALAESYAGVSRGTQSSVMLTLGTGLGSGIVIDGKIWEGAFHQAGEIGHMIIVPDGVPCPCGRSGCAERYCSATALIRAGKQACWSYSATSILKKAKGNVEKINAKMVLDAAQEGDAAALQVFRSFIRYLGMVVDNIIYILNPEMIVLGGGVSYAGDFLLDAVRAQVPNRERTMPFRPLPRIELAQLGNDAGIIGAAMMGVHAAD